MVVLLFAPIEIVRTRLQQTQVGAVSAIAAPPAAAPLANSPTSAFGVARALYTDGGVRSFWRGLVPTLYRDIPFSATYWFTYENMRVALQQRWAAQLTDATAYSDDVPISNANRMVSSFVSGAVAGSLAAIITTPLDLAKSRRQMSIGSGATVGM